MILKYIFIIFIIIAVPLISFGQSSSSGTTSGIQNPLSYNTFTDLINAVLGWILLLAAPIAVIMIIWSAALFMTASGNETKITKAKTTLWWTLVAIFILMISYGISATIANFLNAI